MKQIFFLQKLENPANCCRSCSHTHTHTPSFHTRTHHARMVAAAFALESFVCNVCILLVEYTYIVIYAYVHIYIHVYIRIYICVYV